MPSRWLPPVYRAPVAPRRVSALGRAGIHSPALRVVTIALLTVLVSLLVLGIWWAVEIR